MKKAITNKKTNRKTSRETISNARKIMAVVCCLMIASLSLITAGCGDQADKYIGTWKVSGVSGSGSDWMHDMENSKIVFAKDGKCEVDLPKDKAAGTWEIDGDGKITISISDSEKKMHLTEDGDTLQTKWNNKTVQFEKQ